ncbi:hypothetical protein BV25DRAFT_1914436 [Artomyces pyxidatus]|uniref:Uncharacterized protein n=1 Tax=Artomyces pyxidatus TaxID=48021 RepID=A0ACB8T8G5_9AGAM|nr:hypothetical protein BV25DRAFT_1914436 [Artomyces pyxidatus]
MRSARLRCTLIHALPTLIPDLSAWTPSWFLLCRCSADEYTKTGVELNYSLVVAGVVLLIIIQSTSPVLSKADIRRIAVELSVQTDTYNASVDGLRIQGVMVNRSSYSFFSYDRLQGQLCFDETLEMDGKSKAISVQMIDISNKIFGGLMSGYMTYVTELTKQVEENAKIQEGQPMVQFVQTKGSGYVEPDGYPVALKYAKECYALFQKGAESYGTEALDLLAKSVQALMPDASLDYNRFVPGHVDLEMCADFDTLARKFVYMFYEQGIEFTQPV